MAIQSLFSSTSYLLKRTELDTIALNINFAAINLALLRAVKILSSYLPCVLIPHLQGIIEYKSSFGNFKSDVESCFRQ